ncbi:MAG: hypothetical protein CVV02_11325 [Firmicutes bacterium HGW-Firmicutes-7]|nr:MAG: hypothetical protein CVV02_11325 [Firmicutes bacterium HGW-Firmicutes-7]
MKRKLISYLMTVILVMFLLPTTVSAAETAGTWDDFVLAFNSIKDAGGTITLTANIMKTSNDEVELSSDAVLKVNIDTGDYGIIVADGTLTLDGEIEIRKTVDGAPVRMYNGANLILGGNAFVVGNNFGLLIEGGGGATLNDASVIQVSSTGTAIAIRENSDNRGKLIINGVDCLIEGGSLGIWCGGDLEMNDGNVIISENGAKGIQVADNGIAEISGGILNSTGSSGIALSVDGVNAEAIVSDGTFNSNNYQAIEVLNGGTINISGGTVTGRYYGIYSNDSCLVDVSGGTISATDLSGSGISLNNLCTAHISGASTQISGGGSNGNGIRVELGSEANITGGSVSGAKGISTAGEVNISGGTVNGTNGTGIRAESGAETSVTGGDIVGTINGILSDDATLSIRDGTITGINCGITGSGVIDIHSGSILATGADGVGVSITDGLLITYAGSISGTENGLSIGSTASVVLYNGAIRATGEINPYSIYTEGDPSLTLYSSVLLMGDVYLDAETPVNYRERESFGITAPSPLNVELTEDEQETVSFTVIGDKLDGSSVTLQDHIGNFGTLSNASYTVSGNEIVFTPSSVGSDTLSFIDNITYNGLWSINITINAAVPTGPQTGGGTSGGTTRGTRMPLTHTYKAEAKTVNGTETMLPVMVEKDSGTASVDAGSLNFAQSGTVITIPSIPDVGTYSAGIPVPDLSTTDVQGTLTLNTDMGSITVQSNMLAGIEGMDGNKAQITIGKGDKSNLSDNIRAVIGDKPLIQLTLSIDGKQTDWSNPNAPVTICIPYTPTVAELANPESIVIWYIDDSGNVFTIPSGRYDAVTGMVTYQTTHLSDYAVAYYNVSFNDVADTAWYSNAVYYLAAREITSGTRGDNYSPDSMLTRGECIVLIMRAYGITPDENPTNNFSDAGNTYYTNYLATAKRLGISSSVGDNIYAPDKEITRQEMFTLLYNALKAINQLPEGHSGKTLSIFTDAGQIDFWAKDAMTLLLKTGIIDGSAGKLTPTGTTTRAEMAQVLYNLLSN